MSSNETPSPATKFKTRQRLVSRLPLRFQSMLIAAAIFLGTGALVVLFSAVFINQLKNQMVEVAREEIRRVGENASREIEGIIADYEHRGMQINSLSEIAYDPDIRAQFRILSGQQDVVLTAMINSDGTCIYQYGDTKICPERRGSKLKGVIPGIDDQMTWEFEVRGFPEGVDPERVPVMSHGKTIGYIEYGVEESLALAKLDPISNHISRNLSWMVCLVILTFGLALYLLTKVSKHHLELQRRHDEAQHFASIGTLASGLAHEIRNPLHAMNLHLEAAGEELDDPRENSPEVVKRTITNVQKQIHSLSSILTNFMNYAIPTKLDQESLRLHGLTGEVINLLEPEFDSRNVKVEREISEDAWILADPTAVRQVITNVLLNAAQAMEKSERREIHLRATLQESGTWTVTIDDTGPGLPPGKETAIFDAFVSERKGGTGFGLAIAHRLMEDQGGSITAQTRPEGGARFTLVFPVAQRPADYKDVPNTSLAAKRQAAEEGYIG